MKHLWVFILLLGLKSHSQSVTKPFFELSSPEKWWVIFHPFKAKRAYIISQEALIVTDSISTSNRIDPDINGGQLDAFKHSYWMACLSQNIGARSSIKLGIAHEKGNYKSFKNGKEEDGKLPDKISSDMDLFNNEIGIQILVKNPCLSKSELIELILNDINTGEMRIIKKDAEGHFLTCEGAKIPEQTLIGHWENGKCLVPSNQ